MKLTNKRKFEGVSRPLINVDLVHIAYVHPLLNSRVMNITYKCFSGYIIGSSTSSILTKHISTNEKLLTVVPVN